MKQIDKFIIIKYDYINLNYYVFILTRNYAYIIYKIVYKFTKF